MKPFQITLALLATALLSVPASANDGVDPVLASFERDMNREPTTHSQQPVRVEVDPLTEAIAVALKGTCGQATRTISSAARQPGHGVERKGG